MKAPFSPSQPPGPPASVDDEAGHSSGTSALGDRSRSRIQSSAKGEPRRSSRLWFLLVLVLFAGVVAAALYFREAARLGGSEGSDPASAASAPLEVAFTNLVRVDDLLRLPGHSEPFTGTTLEHYPDGTLRSRTAVVDGLVQGLSEGWHPNGQLQISEHFVAGVSHGRRTKYYASGAKLSEANYVSGELNGLFRRWHENGVLSEEIEFTQGKPEGVSRAWFPSGHLKARVVMQSGQPIEQQYWSDGETPSEDVSGFRGDPVRPVSGG